MICPYCNHEMEKGYINARDGVVWRPKSMLVAAVGAWMNDALVLADRSALAYKCKECRKIILEYEEE